MGKGSWNVNGFRRRPCICNRPLCPQIFSFYAKKADSKLAGYHQVLIHSDMTTVNATIRNAHRNALHYKIEGKNAPVDTKKRRIAHHHFHSDILADGQGGPENSSHPKKRTPSKAACTRAIVSLAANTKEIFLKCHVSPGKTPFAPMSVQTPCSVLGASPPEPPPRSYLESARRLAPRERELELELAKLRNEYEVVKKEPQVAKKENSKDKKELTAAKTSLMDQMDAHKNFATGLNRRNLTSPEWRNENSDAVSHLFGFRMNYPDFVGLTTTLWPELTTKGAGSGHMTDFEQLLCALLCTHRRFETKTIGMIFGRH